MTFWEHIKKFERQTNQGSWIQKFILHHSDTLQHYTSFLDGIPDEYKNMETINVFYQIYAFIDCNTYDYTTQSKTPKRVIKRDIETVEKFLEFINRLKDRDNFKHVGELDSNELNDVFKENLKTFIGTSESILQDLNNMKKSTNKDKMILVRKRAYFDNETTKKDIENRVLEILKRHSLPIDFLSVREFISKF
ncbi:MAG: hypothetical protein WA099_04625 [Sulfuricurvum sp.]